MASLGEQGIEPEKPPYHPGGRTEFRICFVADPDGYRIELIDGEFETFAADLKEAVKKG